MPEKDLPDIHSLHDDRNIPLDRVGVKGLRWPITVLDKKHGKQNTIATVNMYVNLPHNFRGTHMSRFVEVLNEYRGIDWIDKTGEILKKIRKSLDADEAHGALPSGRWAQVAADRQEDVQVEPVRQGDGG